MRWAKATLHDGTAYNVWFVSARTLNEARTDGATASNVRRAREER